ncbi:uncharacterized protein N7484_000740 [Penicillium longicatenatum]|uniref:uncharacterized protein n=1 Tax=Penicillium longicatenatum TaxID=1561947 RepID=UPI002548BED7|nr:uncharacterized protein N7484_000740 [Penicillium longicatenatum]KAJ5661368.1 hypothetical protein N7484_000740 [Penicillium longicatenatum]
MLIISPLSRCASSAKRDIFLQHIGNIAPVTKSHEPKCLGYAWFKSAQDNDTVPHHWLRGFEIYEDVEANTIEHRASAEYKAFRIAVGEEELLEQPSDLRFWRPTDVGFLTRRGSIDFAGGLVHGKQYIVVDELRTELGKCDLVFDHLRKIAVEAENVEQVFSFWVLRREDEKDLTFMVFSGYLEKEAWAKFNAQAAVDEAWVTVYGSSEEQKRTTWVESGLGFLGR